MLAQIVHRRADAEQIGVGEPEDVGAFVSLAFCAREPRRHEEVDDRQRERCSGEPPQRRPSAGARRGGISHGDTA